jgi:HD-like signal output (HDOD) protein
MLAAPTVGLNKKRALKVLDELEPFSPIAGRLLSTLSTDPDTISMSHVGDLIERDTILAGKILSLANSALYNRGVEVVSIHRAIAALGLNKIRNTVLALSVNRVWRKAKTPVYWSMVRFNLHSLASAVAADLLATRTKTNYPEGAFVSGLFHDIGRLVMAVMLQSEYEPFCNASEDNHPRVRNCERDMLGFDHCELSADILAHWKLPREIQTAVGLHECPEMDDTVVGDSEFPLSMVIHTADKYAMSVGASIYDTHPSAEQADPLQLLGTSDEEGKFFPEFKSQFDLIRSFMN